jgi:hypothetical protein
MSRKSVPKTRLPDRLATHTNQNTEKATIPHPKSASVRSIWVKLFDTSLRIEHARRDGTSHTVVAAHSLVAVAAVVLIVIAMKITW